MVNRIFIKHQKENITPVIYDILKNLPEDCENIIEFEKGTYYFHKEGSSQYPIFSAAGRCCDGRPGNVLFPLINIKNLTIDGCGSDFVFCDRVQPFMLKDSKNITLRNFTTDYSFLRYAYGDVVSATDEGFEISINKELSNYYVDENILYFVCGSEAVSTKTRKISVKPIGGTKTGICFMYVGDYEGEYNGAATNVFVDVQQKEETLLVRYKKDTQKPPFIIEAGDRLCMAYDNDREYQLVILENCKNTVINNISIYRNGGMGIAADVCENVLIDGIKFGLKPGRDEYYSSTADAIFSTNCSGDFILRNSSIIDTYDDALNIHGYYLKVKEVGDNNKLTLGNVHVSHKGILSVKEGDMLYFNDPETATELFSAKVETVSYDESRENMYLTVSDTNGIKPGMIVENKTRMANLLVENNVIKRCPHLRISARNAIIRNNILSLKNGDIFVDDLWGFWAEYGALENAEITGNRFGIPKNANITVRSCRPEGHNRNHKNIVIKDNTFENSYEKAISVSSADNVIMENNKFGVKFEG